MKAIETKVNKKQISGIEWFLISKYRTELMGICTIGIILCHANINNVVLPSIVRNLFSFGNYGVDIFLLLSGMGMYFSLKKGAPLGLWYTKRFLRIGIPYLIFCVPFYIWYTIKNGGGIIYYLFHLSTIGFWVENFGLWYIALLVPLYLITPLFANVINALVSRTKTGKSYQIIYICAVCILTFVICGVGVSITTGTLNNFLSRWIRTPSYFIGYYSGYAVEGKKKADIRVLIILTAVIILTVKIPLLSLFHFEWLLSVPMSLLLCLVLSHLPKCFLSMLRWFGERSLEFYCTALINHIIIEIPVWDTALNYNGYLFYTVVIICQVILSEVIYRIKNLRSISDFSSKMKVRNK